MGKLRHHRACPDGTMFGHQNSSPNPQFLHPEFTATGGGRKFGMDEWDPSRFWFPNFAPAGQARRRRLSDTVKRKRRL